MALAHKGTSSMVKIRWTEAAPAALSDTNEAEELGAKWEGDELVTYDLGGFCDLHSY